ncbi:acetoacetate metabolism regulatory protein AtoC [Tepiditoga spiralis]|uniref:Acetoacetate metabolism regulatory protein AtoC n=1 Tax=Tepiditoga spiralis TaxID=2108365 RepID=A0A7G1GBS6_9BACT|nr:sigma-54 dependent transcriptional regulator [Tepiditoga spiralis]BBE31319.1 acetoacetate metabolism regulatory protein AtoC [Tepiditoga spiralis]
MRKILIVEDDISIGSMLKKFIESKDIEVEIAENGMKAKHISKKFFPDIILLDLKLPDIYGFDLIGDIKQYTKEIIIITAHGDIDDAVRATKMGVYDFFEKPIDFIKLGTSIENIYKMLDLKEKVENKKKNSNKIIGNSNAIRSLKLKIKKIAEKNISVLLLGESGTGKEVLARSIHNLSKRKKFVAVNCGAIPEELFESELFGYEKGSFTGADTAKPGKIEMADGGTLFLDEIGDLPKNMQVKLLRVLETKEVERIGSTKSKKVDIRIIAATNRKFDEMIKNGQFRDDLFFRISVIELIIPPLRERKEDIPELANYFVMNANEDLETNVKEISKEVLDSLVNYEWPGNIRELRNIIYAMVALSDGNILTCDMLPVKLKNINKNKEFLKIPLGLNLEEVEKIYIEETLKKIGNNKTQAAKMLGISKVTLFAKLKKWKEE